MDTMTIELDVAYEQGEGLEGALFELMNELPSLTCRVDTPKGPGGGWPVVAFTGTREDVVALVRRYDPSNDAGLLDELAA